jgi:hypothetical protein
MIRSIGVPAALFVIVGLPFIVAPPEQEPPAPREGALTVNLEGGTGESGESPAFLKVVGPGAQPTKATVLNDPTGTDTADVSFPTGGECDDAPPLYAFPAGDEWCLRLTSVETGREFAGTVTTDAAKLALTVARRDRFWGWPAAFIALGFVAGLLVLIVPRALRSLTVSALLSNRLASKEAKQIRGLGDWVRHRIDAGDKSADVLRLVDKVLESGLDQASEARATLKDALAKEPIGAHKYAVKAGAVATATTHDVSDFLTAEGKERPFHPAAEWKAGLDRLHQAKTDIDEYDGRIKSQLKKECRQVPETHLGEARTTWSEIDAPDEVTRIDSRLEALRTSYENAFSDRDCKAAGVSGAGAPLREWLGGRLEIADLVLTGSGRSLLMSGAVLLTVMCILAALAFAFFTTKTASYDPKSSFGTSADYFALFSAALGSGAAATVLGLLANWRPEGSAEEA